VNADQLRRVLRFMLDENEFLSPFGLRALSREYIKEEPYRLPVNRMEYGVDYGPAESSNGLFEGNSNWRRPIWFPVNAAELLRRLTRISLKDDHQSRPVHRAQLQYSDDPHWRDLAPFYEYFHGDDGQSIEGPSRPPLHDSERILAEVQA
jgi:hypothetical protein